MDERSKKVVLYFLCSAGMVTTLSQLVFLPSVAAMREELAASTLEVSMTIALYSLSLAVAQLVYGPLADKFKPKLILLAGLAIFSVSSLGIFFSPAIGAIITFRVTQALGIAAVGVCGNALISDMFEGAQRDKSISIFQMFHSVGAAFGPVVGATVALFFSWRFSFLILALWSLAVLVILLRKLPAGRLVNTFSFAAAARLVRAPDLLLLCLAAAGTAFVIQSFHTSLGFLFADFLHVTAAWTGYVYMAIPLGVFTGSNVARFLLNHLHRENIAMIGLCALAVFSGLFAAQLALVPDARVVYTLIPNLYLVGISLGTVFSMMTSVMINWFIKLRGTAIAVLFFTRHLAGTLGPAAVGFLIDLEMVRSAYLVIFLAAFIAVPLYVWSLYSHRRRSEQPDEPADMASGSAPGTPSETPAGAAEPGSGAGVRSASSAAGSLKMNA